MGRVRELDLLTELKCAEWFFESLIGLREADRLPPLTVDSAIMLVFGPNALISLSSAY